MANATQARAIWDKMETIGAERVTAGVDAQLADARAVRRSRCATCLPGDWRPIRAPTW
eukprot:CAMPEP_0194349970 /NCGR_PEP_ID=MMETSP0171-20130528/107382_1 /TAXON_ID=218684 /ORGANISM="Corethron pennatum, Strain L29A3" /LENGTH=57 /DNA_ID=CAMNT_0039117475 /DNA_START=134 /DNA_END=304 /DNA_ORIENTATION=-